MRHFKLILRGAGAPEELTVAIEGSRLDFSRPGATAGGEATRLPDGRLSLLFDDGRQLCGRVVPGSDGEVELTAGGRRMRIALAEPLRDRLAHATDRGEASGEDEEVRALMPGRVVEVTVATGDQLPAGALLLVLEAMKMQNEIRTARGGEVLRIEVASGARVEGGALLVVVKPPAETESAAVS